MSLLDSLFSYLLYTFSQLSRIIISVVSANHLLITLPIITTYSNFYYRIENIKKHLIITRETHLHGSCQTTTQKYSKGDPIYNNNNSGDSSSTASLIQGAISF